MDRDAAETKIRAVFSAYRNATSHVDPAVLATLSDGKLYELFVLSELLLDLSARGCRMNFVGGVTLKFKASPGKIKTSDPHFKVRTPGGVDLKMFVDIEFQTLGMTQTSVSDYSQNHELDIVVVLDNCPANPPHDAIALAVECKSGKFTKALVKGVLGVRREMCFLQDRTPSILSALGARPSRDVPAFPASEFWLAFIDPAGLNYQESPSAFGIDFKWLQP